MVPSIGDYALLSDSHGAALVSSSGSVDWLCFDRFDEPPVMSHLLDDRAGRFSIGPVTPGAEVRRRYLPDTLVLETTFTTSTGVAVLEDALAIVPGREHVLAEETRAALIRRVTCTEGSVELEAMYSPRPEFGLIRPLLWSEDGVVRARGGASRLSLSSSVPFSIAGSDATARFSLSAGSRTSFSLRHRRSSEAPAPRLSERERDEMLDETVAAWRGWQRAHEIYQGPYADLVLLSGRVLQGLTFQPTGAMVAAPTTSLPETIGGERNWDYRFSWVRDASFTIQALYRSTCPEEADRFFEWIAGATAAGLDLGEELQIMFGIGGEHDLSERTLPHLSGYRGSAPVRVGNGAWDQRQLDVYGEVLDAAATYADRFHDLDPISKRFLTGAADAAAACWPEPDHGIWEVRIEPRHFLYSKLMCWVALDRAVELATLLGATDRAEGWTATRDRIRAAIERDGWNEPVHAYTQAFGSADLDASALMLSIVGFLPPQDPRMRATVEAIRASLTDDHGLVNRYLASDGLAGDEGAFLLCTFWLAQALAMDDRLDEARATFERAIACRNDVDLMSEEVDPATGELLGNFPQAFSHIGLINAAWAIGEAEQRLGA